MTLDLVENIKKNFPGVWAKEGHEFDGGGALVWTGEGSIMPDGTPAFDMYNPAYHLGVHPELHEYAKRHECYWEAYDAGTFLLYRY